MKKTFLILGFIAMSMGLWAQDTEKGKPATAVKEAEKPKSEDRRPPNTFYRIEYVVTELDNGKAVNRRNYTLSISDGSQGSVRIGNRVPVSNAGGGFNYLDV